MMEEETKLALVFASAIVAIVALIALGVSYSNDQDEQTYRACIAKHEPTRCALALGRRSP